MSDMTTQSNEALIRRAQRGDETAFRTLVLRHDRKVLGLACRMLGNNQDAEDVYQEVFLNVYTHIGQFKFQSAFETWLYRITVNTAINYRKKRNKHMVNTLMTDEIEEKAGWVPEDDSPLPDQLTISREIREMIDEALEKFTPIQRTVFTLRYYQDFKISDIAEIMDCAEGTIKNTLFRTTNKMRHILSRNFE
jgi:RNA polymerase sigma-70 factor, ECF subfamily